MARKTTYHCDRCGKEFFKKGITRFICFPRKLTSFLWMDNECLVTTEFDLCKDCSDAFYTFIGNKEVKPNDRT